MLKQFLSTAAAVVLLTSCGTPSEKVQSLKRTDKNLTCSDIQLEINEADFYKKQANDKRRLGIKSIVMPIGYIDTYMSADEAIEAAQARIDYLNRISDIKKCDEQSASTSAPKPDNSFHSVAMNPQENEISNNIQKALAGSGANFAPVNYSMSTVPQSNMEPIGYSVNNEPIYSSNFTRSY